MPGAANALTLADLNADGRPELTIAVNSGPLQVYSEPVVGTNRMLEVRLVGKPGNPTAAGARVSVKGAAGKGTQTAELAAGSGYLSQSEAALWFGLGSVAETAPVEVTVRWPDGSTATTTTTAAARRVVVRAK